MIGDGPAVIHQTKCSTFFPRLSVPYCDNINVKNTCDARAWLLEQLLKHEAMQEYDDDDYDEGDMSDDDNSDPWEEDDFSSMFSSGHSSLTSTDRSPVIPEPPLMCPTYAPVITNFSNVITNGHTVLDNDKTCIDNDVVPDYTPIPDPQSPNGLCLISAAVTGFTTEKPSGNITPGKPQTYRHLDIVFIVELTWSDGRVNVVKRTYTDFCRFQYYLINEFVDVAVNESPARLNVYLPGKEPLNSHYIYDSRVIEFVFFWDGGPSCDVLSPPFFCIY